MLQESALVLLHPWKAAESLPASPSISQAEVGKEQSERETKAGQLRKSQCLQFLWWQALQ